MKDFLLIVVFIVSLYAGVSTFRYQFAHPEQTDTQRLLNFTNALLWK